MKELMRDVDGELMLSPEALSLLFGVDVALIEAQGKSTMHDGHITLPQAWWQAGRRRTREAAAATGSEDLVDILGYWAARERGAEIVFRPDDAGR
jgi:hypothetical protein